MVGFFNTVIFFLFGVAVIIEHLVLFILPLLIQSTDKVYEVIILVAILRIIVCQLSLERKIMLTLSKRGKKSIKEIL